MAESDLRNDEKLNNEEGPASQKELSYNLLDPRERKPIIALGKALHIEDRLRVLSLIMERPMSQLELSKAAKLPLSSVSNHVNALADAGLIYISYQPAPKGHIKICHPAVTGIRVVFGSAKQEDAPEGVSYEMPVGLFSDANVAAPCGMAGAEEMVVAVDSPGSFFDSGRAKAELLWFSYGYVTYSFPVEGIDWKKAKELSFSLELCSEAVYYRTIWPSDVTFSVNGVEICLITLPGDFGGRRGVYSPAWWGLSSTQFGVLKKISVTEEGVYVNGLQVNDSVSLSSLHPDSYSSVKLTISVKKDAAHVGGVNIFGHHFGDYPQAIVMGVK
jgi:predicted transcriptional regulator